MSSPSHSVTVWIDRLRESDPLAAEELWRRFFSRMVEVARRRLGDSLRRVADEEDAALDAFDRFHRGVQAGRFPDLQDRDDLWRILFVLTVNAAANACRDGRRQKRGGGEGRGDSAIGEGPLAAEPSPEEAACLRERLARMLAALP